MTPTKLLVGQIILVFAVVICGVWIATQWTAAELGYQWRLGPPWFTIFAYPIYYPWRLFEWWYAFDAYAPSLFNDAGILAASSGFAGITVAITGSFWRARQNGTSPLMVRHAGLRCARSKSAGLFRDRGRVPRPAGQGQYLRHDGPEHVMAFAPTRSGKGVGACRPDAALAGRKASWSTTSRARTGS